MIQKWKLKTRLIGFFLLIKSILPLVLFVFLFFIPFKVMNSEDNRKIYNLYNHEMDVLMEHFNDMESEINALKLNARNAKESLVAIKDEMVAYVTQKGDAAEKFWYSVKAKLGENTTEFLQFKDLVEEMLFAYIDIVDEMIGEVREYIDDIFEFKDDISKFLSDFQKELEPLNDLSDAIEELDVLGIFDPVVFEFPDIPIFPSFPSLDFERLKPDFTPILEGVSALGKGLLADIDLLKRDMERILTPPDLAPLLSLLSSENLIANFIDPVRNMGDVLSSYMDELREAQTMINDELLERKAQLEPWNKLLVWTLVITLLFWCIGYLIKFRQKMILAFKLIRGEEVTYSPLNL